MKLRGFLVESVFCHLQDGNYEFKLAVWTNTENIRKVFERVTSWNGNFLNKLRRNYKKSVYLGGE